MHGINLHPLSPSISFFTEPQNSLSPTERMAISKFLMQEVSDQHTNLQINNMLINAFNTGDYQKDPVPALVLTNFKFSLPHSETCVVPPSVILDQCSLISAGTMIFSQGKLEAVRYGATVIANGKCLATANTRGSTSIARAPGSVARAESGGYAYAVGPKTRAHAYFAGIAFADSDQSEAFAKGLYAMAHARVEGAESFAAESDTTATSSNGATATATVNGSTAVALTSNSIAVATAPGSSAFARAASAIAEGKKGGRAIGEIDGAFEINNGITVVVKTTPRASYDAPLTGTKISAFTALTGLDPESVRQRKGIDFQGSYGNKSITAQDLGLDDDLDSTPAAQEVVDIRSKPQSIDEPVAIHLAKKAGQDEGNRFITNEDLD